MEVVKAIEAVGSSNGKTAAKVVIADCGVEVTRTLWKRRGVSSDLWSRTGLSWVKQRALSTARLLHRARLFDRCYTKMSTETHPIPSPPTESDLGFQRSSWPTVRSDPHPLSGGSRVSRSKKLSSQRLGRGSAPRPARESLQCHGATVPTEAATSKFFNQRICSISDQIPARHPLSRRQPFPAPPPC